MSSEKCAVIDCNDSGKFKIPDLRVFQMRAKPIPIDDKCKVLCFKHNKKYCDLYEINFGKECCNPLKDPNKKHKTSVKSKLKQINLEIAYRYDLIPGKKICVKCLDHLKDSRKDRTEVEITVPEYESPPMEFPAEPDTSMLNNTFGNF
jgi:hypothetical protein